MINERKVNLIDRKRFLLVFRLIFVLFLLVLLLNGIHITLSRYESGAKSSADAKIAFFITDVGSYEQSISLTGMVPSATNYQYKFLVKNNDGTDRCQVNLKYTIDFKMTTNLPLSVQIVDENDANVVSSDEVIQDANNVYYHEYHCNQAFNFGYVVNETDVYTLIVNFPEQYKNYPTEYQSLVDMFTITINAEQVVS